MPVSLAPLESPESASPIVTRAVAAGLLREYSDTYQFAAWQRLLLKVIGRLPQEVARYAISRFETLSGLDPKCLAGLSSNTLANERLNDYTAVHGPFPNITMGAALGGASAHLALALGGPFLPQAFVTTLRGGAPDGDVQAYFKRSADLALEVARNNPDLLTIQHYDPIHDEWMTRYVNHLRYKLLDLPAAYADFIRNNLEPGGSICFLDSQASWLRYRVGERSVFQVGGWGDISPREFLEGSERIRRYCQSVGMSHSQWRLPGYPLEEGPESEWGCEAGLGAALENFCAQEGYRFVRITFPEPHNYSLLAYRAIAHLLKVEGRQPAGVLVEMFSQFDSNAVVQSGLLPLWLVFNTWDSLAFLKAMLPSFPKNIPVFFSPLATFTITADLVPWDEWETALNGTDWRNIGTRPSHYPADALALTQWSTPLRAWVEEHKQPLSSNLGAETLAQLAAEIPVPPQVSLAGKL